MLTTPVLLTILLAFAAYALLSRKIEGGLITLPMIFTGVGLALGQVGFDMVTMEAGYEGIHLMAEITLILVLFSDASQVQFASLQKDAAIPIRMLLIGMPLTLLFGTLLTMAVMPDVPWALALLLAAILTPTDAALGKAVAASPSVPDRIRQGINVESGLNDGLALPIVLLAAITAAQVVGLDGERGPDNVAVFALLQIGLGPLAGIAVGYLAAKLLDVAVGRQLATPVSQGVYFLTIAFMAYYVAEWVGGNGFIAAYTGGLVFGNVLRAPSMFIREFMEGEGQLLTMATFLVFGAVLAPIGLAHLSWQAVVIALLFLTVVRMVPVVLSLLGLPLTWFERLFLGWFGPRGLASILFALLVLDRFPLPGIDELVACVVLTVLLSIVLHGVSAAPLSNRFRSDASGDSQAAA